MRSFFPSKVYLESRECRTPPNRRITEEEHQNDHPNRPERRDLDGQRLTGWQAERFPGMIVQPVQFEPEQK